jgi:acetyl/propionyl-CoA carboxylase alpha subunit
MENLHTLLIANRGEIAVRSPLPRTTTAQKR